MKIKALKTVKNPIAEYIDATINHQINLEYYSNHVAARIDNLLKKAEQQIQSEIYQRLEFAPLNWGLALAEKSVSDIIYQDTNYQKQAELNFNDALRDASDYATNWQLAQFQKEFPTFNFSTPAPMQVYQAAMSQPFEGRYLKEWWNDNSQAAKKKIMTNFRIGYLRGQSTGKMTQSVIQTLKESGSISDKTDLSTLRRNTESIVRTAISHVANKSRETVASKNSDIIEKVTFIATLDTRTCLVCGKYDGQSWAVNDPTKPTIPVHFRCRCTWGYKMVKASKLGIPEINYEKQRASVDGTVNASVSYKDWLAAQSATRQDVILGQVKGSMYRSGNYDPFNFTNLKSNQYDIDALNKTLKEE